MLPSLIHGPPPQTDPRPKNAMRNRSGLETRYPSPLSAGEKVCESGKVQLIGGEANFDRKISISCNMIFNTRAKVFK